MTKKKIFGILYTQKGTNKMREDNIVSTLTSLAEDGKIAWEDLARILLDELGEEDLRQIAEEHNLISDDYEYSVDDEGEIDW